MFANSLQGLHFCDGILAPRVIPSVLLLCRETTSEVLDFNAGNLLVFTRG